jgi:hypothetical protein
VIALLLVGAALGSLWGRSDAVIGEEAVAYVIVVDGMSLPALLEVPEASAIARAGGAALMNGRSPVRDEILSLTPACPGVEICPLDPPEGLVYEDMGAASPEELGERIREIAGTPAGGVLLMVVSASPPASTAANGDELGAVVASWDDSRDLLAFEGGPRSLTSDSTRRAGVVATVDPAATVAEWLDLPYDAGAPIQTTDEPAPLDLYERYLEQRRLAVPVAAISWSVMGLAGLVGLLALRFRHRLSDRSLAATAALAGSLPWLALALLLVGHLPSLTPWTVFPFLVVVTAACVAFTRWIAVRRGILSAIAAAGAVILMALGVEAATGWPAAVTPLAGGGQLDGGRFFGMPNVEIGLVLGAALFAAHRLPTIGGVALLAVCALVTGSPWTGANFGSAITLFATAGLWLGIRTRRSWWIVALLTAAITTAGMLVIAVMHRYLTTRPTHVTAFLDQTTGVVAAVERLVDRFGIGLDLLADSPFSALPVIGTAVLLVVVLRAPEAVAASFEGRDRWRDAVLVILLGSVVAYLANDTGAAALGFGFGFAMSGLLDVSLTTAREKMRR